MHYLQAASRFGVRSRRLTDIYLLGLAVRMKGRLATFDRAVPIDVVRHAARESIAVIGLAEA
jgi:hypothetical protein